MRRTKQVRFASVLALSIVTSAAAYPQLPPLKEALSQAAQTEELKTFFASAPKDRTAVAIRDLLRDPGIDFNQRIQEQIVRQAAARDLVTLIKDLTPANQAGSGGKSSGSTSLVSHGILPMALSMAVENGALTQSTSGTVATFRGNLYGLTQFLLGGDPYCLTSQCTAAMQVFRRISFSAGFDVGQTGTTTVNATDPSKGSTSQVPLTNFHGKLDSFSLRFDGSNNRDVRSTTFKTAWAEKLTDAGLLEKAKSLAQAVDALNKFQETSQMGDIRDRLVAVMQDPSKASSLAQMESVIQAAVDEATKLAWSGDANLGNKVRAALKTRNVYLDTLRPLAVQALARLTYGIQYDFNRPKNQPTQSSVLFVISGSPTRNEKTMLSANLGVTWYNNRPAGTPVKILRDAQVSLQLDRTLASNDASALAFSLAGYYQYMADRAILTIGPGDLAPGTNIQLPGPAATLLAPRGNLAVAQAKLTLTVKGTGLKIPLAISWSNRTELIKATEVRGHVGITYDFDSLFGKK